MLTRAYIFDIDDTLTATTKSNRRARRAGMEFVLRGLGAEADGRAAALEKRLYRIFGWSKMPDLWQALALELGLERPGEVLLEDAKALFEETFIQVFHQLPAVESTLRSLLDSGSSIGIITDGDEDLQWKKLRHTGLDNFFEPERVLISIQSDFYNAKPSTANFRRMEKLLKMRAHQMLYVGDKPWDIAAANVAGWISVRTRQALADEPDDWPFPPLEIQKPAKTIMSFSELLDLK